MGITRWAGLVGALAGTLLPGALLPFGARAQGMAKAARGALPAVTRASGVLRVATSLWGTPFAFTDAEDKRDGIDIPLIMALTQRLGLRTEVEDTRYPTIKLGVTSRRYDIGLDQVNITAEQAKVVDPVPYSKDSLGLLLPRGRGWTSTTCAAERLC